MTLRIQSFHSGYFIGKLNKFFYASKNYCWQLFYFFYCNFNELIWPSKLKLRSFNNYVTIFCRKHHSCNSSFGFPYQTFANSTSVLHQWNYIIRRFAGIVDGEVAIHQYSHQTWKNLFQSLDGSKTYLTGWTHLMKRTCLSRPFLLHLTRFQTSFCQWFFRFRVISWFKMLHCTLLTPMNSLVLSIWIFDFWTISPKNSFLEVDSRYYSWNLYNLCLLQ